MARLIPYNRQHPTNNTLFILTGGPGESGWTFILYAAYLFPPSDGITIILPDHRGIGLSTSLSCDNYGSQNIDVNCISYLTSKWSIEGLNQFSITSAAHDLSVQIRYYQSIVSSRIAVFGMSYGTIWLDRFLQIYPNLVQASIMDSAINPILMSFSRYDLWASLVATKILAYCQLQPECNRYFPASEPPQIMLSRILKELDENNQRCVNNYFSQYQLTADKLRNIFSGMMYSSESFYDRTVIPAVIFRLNRCNQDDVTLLKFFFQTKLGTQNGTGSENLTIPSLLGSAVLGYNIVQSELWLGQNEEEVDLETILSWHNSTLVGSKDPTLYISLRSKWPKYPLNEYYHKVATNSTVLMLAGQLDPAAHTDYAIHLAALTAKTRTFYSFPLIGHIVILVAQFGYQCPLKLVSAWAFPNLFPSNWSDPNCVQEFPTTINFVGADEGGEYASMKHFNISKPFDNLNSTIVPSSTIMPNSSIPATNGYNLFIYFALVFLTLFV
ncbi:unnamed protein product [Rotaria sp. Silwood2]|nr:unnamed protein product [Rotaria sp. Silwood2]CAF2977717.1 unnamed protein product [Rotaria sp. Silwood2]CAF3308937.1 unnamed protein product [Rotaria sp. Silwood2]CAF4137722.1 unnamed protein product [Rotaria sp. Silwood2]CAF4277195.1 unnamed protein product [Rotaria sp. Silwood2]